MKTNLGFANDNATLQNYFKNQDLINTTKFAYYASRGDELNDEEVRDYKHTWLAKHHLAVVEKRDVQELTVQEDQDEEAPLINEHKQVSKTILRWNFPTFRTMYLDILTNIVTRSTKDVVNDICKKEPSFAGF